MPAQTNMGGGFKRPQLRRASVCKSRDDFHPRRFYNIAYSALYAHYRYHLELNAFMETTCSHIRLHNAF